MKKSLFHLSLLCSLFFLLSCSSDGDAYRIFYGKLNNEYVNSLTGFPDQKSELLERQGISAQEFVSLTTAKAASLTELQRAKLYALRTSLLLPTRQTLLQKVIPLTAIPSYMENLYQGTIGGTVYVASDLKGLQTMNDIYWALRLDYKGSEFKEDGAGYGLIRFYSPYTDFISIPFAPEMGGAVTDEWPFAGGGFTPSTLGEGGYPEYVMNGYYSPEEGAELYECTPNGYQILRSVYTKGKWTTYEGSVVSTKATPLEGLSPREVNYKGYRLYLRGATQEGVHLFTSDHAMASELEMELFDKGEYRLIVPASMISEVE